MKKQGCMKLKKIGVNAEYDRAKTILMHTPGEELFFGCLHGIAALFEDKPFDRFDAQAEHKGYVNKLQEQGVDVILVKDVLLQGTIDENGKKVESDELGDLVEFAAKSLQISYPSDLQMGDFVKMQNYKVDTLKQMHPTDLVRIIMEKPKIGINVSNEGNTAMIADSYNTQPVMNMHFLRDQQITTDKGVVIGKMNSTQRRAETDITKFVFKKLGIEPTYEITGNGRLEGGDFIPCGEYAMIGQGLRTNAEGIKQLLENGAFGYHEIAVVKDSYGQQDEMHLDTFFNIAGSNKAIIMEERVDHYDDQGNFVSANPDKKTTVDVYHLDENEEYVLRHSDMPFQTYLAEKGFTVGLPGKNNSLITLTKEEQLNYGCNFLSIDENEVIAVKGVSENYLNKMNGIKVHEIEFSNFVKTYGAPHCATQVIERDENIQSQYPKLERTIRYE